MTFDVYWRISDAKGSSWQCREEVAADSHEQAHFKILVTLDEFEDMVVNVRSYDLSNAFASFCSYQIVSKWEVV